MVPTLNRLPLLQEAVASVTAQRAIEWELIVVDDASDDGTGDWLRDLTDPRIRPIYLPERSMQCIVRNAGLNEVRAPLVMFLDDDDVLRPDALTSLKRILVNEQQAVGAIGANLVFDDRGHRRRVTHPRRQMVRNVWPEVVAGWGATPSRVLLRTDVVRSVGGWDETIDAAPDHDLWLRLSTRGPFVLTPQITLLKRNHPGQSRPPDVQKVETAFRHRFVEGLQEPDKERGRRLLLAREVWRSGGAAYARGDALTAMRDFVKVVRIAPAVLLSPISRPYIVKDLMKTIPMLVLQASLGRARAASVAAGLRRFTGDLLRNKPGGNRKVGTR